MRTGWLFEAHYQKFPDFVRCAKVVRMGHEAVDEIIALAASETGSIATLLRKCLVLGNTLKSVPLQRWCEKELIGYEQDDSELPEYRKVPAIAKGFFLGPGGRHINDQPIPPAMLKEHHRHYAETAFLLQPIASYDGVTNDGCIEWPPNITGLYQRTFFQGTYALNRTWQEIPASVFVGLIDTVKTRVLRFALELKNDLGIVSDDVTRLRQQTIERNIVFNIYGGTNVVGSRDFAQVNHIEIERGDWSGLFDAVRTLGVPQEEIAKLQHAVSDDSKSATTSPVEHGQTARWLKEFGKNAGQWALKTGTEIAKTEITKWLSGYFGGS